MLTFTTASWIAEVAMLLALMADCADAYHIFMMPLPGKSHAFSMAAMAEHLTSRGHKVSFFVGENFPLNVPELRDRPDISVVRYRDATGGVRMDYDRMEENITRAAMENEGDVPQLAGTLAEETRQWCHHLTVENDDLFDRLANQRFDLAVVDGIFFAKCYYLIPHRLGVPWITYSDAVDPLVVRTPWLPSFVPAPILPLSDRMSFLERLRNTLTVFAFSFLLPLKFPDPPSDVLDKYRKYGDFDTLNDLASRSQLWLLTKDDVLDYAHPMMPNMVSVGGLTVKRTTGELPSDMRKFVEGARKGTILVTFGSMAASLPRPILGKFVIAFGRLEDYRVIWRLKNVDEVKLPDNVLISDWLPQNDLLAHPAVKLFITHSGNNGQFEAVYHGVPMIGFPLLGDQIHNAKRLEKKGYGIHMDLYHFTPEELVSNIRRIVSDESYKQRVQKASAIFRSRPQSPVERATFWIEHICRFGGEHLRSAGNDLPLHQYLLLDVLAAALLTFLVALWLIVKLFRFCGRKCCGGSPHDSDTATSKKSD